MPPIAKDVTRKKKKKILDLSQNQTAFYCYL